MQILWSPSSDVLTVQMGLGQRSREALAESGLDPCMSDPQLCSEGGLEGTGLGHSTVAGSVTEMSPWHLLLNCSSKYTWKLCFSPCIPQHCRACGPQLIAKLGNPEEAGWAVEGQAPCRCPAPGESRLDLPPKAGSQWRPSQAPSNSTAEPERAQPPLGVPG